MRSEMPNVNAGKTAPASRVEQNNVRAFAIVTFAARNTVRPPKQAKFFRITSCQNAAALWLIDG
jgi:hypothetical protein